MDVLVVGAGIFGVTASLALRARGHEVRLIDPGPIPHRDAESSDINKVIRLDYGADEATTAMMETAIERWRDWNKRWTRYRNSTPFFEETGVFFASHAPMQPGGFEHDSMDVLLRRGHRVERLDAGAITRRFPAFAKGALVDGYFNPIGGWAAAGTVVEKLAHAAVTAGVKVEPGVRAERLHERGSRIAGIVDDKGAVREADFVVLATGSWTTKLCPWLAPHLRPNGQPVFYLVQERRSKELRSPRFPVFGADIAKTGWYGFPVASGCINKIANHGVGRSVDPALPIPNEMAKREVSEGETWKLRQFLTKVIPMLADAQIVSSNVCVYCDTADGNFWIAPDPDREGLVVASGGSGHGFKFAPVIGDIIADAVEGKVDPRFRWRPETVNAASTEAARARS